MKLKLLLICLLPSLALAQANPTPDYTTTGYARFSDSVLEGLIQSGLTNSPNLRTALSRLEEARIRVRIARSFLLPSVRSSVLVTTQSLSEHRPIAIPTVPCARGSTVEG